MSDSREIFRETAERVLADTLTPSHIAAAERRILPAELFSALAETGVTAMLAPDAQGGVDAPISDAVAILRAAGAAAAPGPLLETMLGHLLMARAGIEAPPGALTLIFHDADTDMARAGMSWRGPLTLANIPWGGLAERILIVVPAPTGVGLVSTRPLDWTVTPGVDAAGEPRDRLSVQDLSNECALLDGVTFDALFATASVMRAGQQLGALEWILRRSVEYAMERKQFGRELGKFQVVQQMLAELADNVLAAAAITEAAAECGSAALVAAARSRIADASDTAVTIAHQVHGALGFSREYPLNLRTRRLMAWRNDYGDVLFWRRRLAGGFLGLSREAFWPAVADAGLSRAG
jgi:acyl-CoA dehydrogenase